MAAFNILGGVGVTSAPLINFNTVIDEDLSLISYIIKEVRNYEVFDLDKVSSMTFLDIVKEIYHRKYSNPLYFLMKDESKKEFLDQCYKEFMDKPEFLEDFAISTDMYNVVQRFNDTGEIFVTLIYNNDYEKAVIDNDSLLSKIEAKRVEDVDLDYYTQIWFNKISDAERFKDKGYKKTYYFSSTGINMNDSNDDLAESEIVDLILKRQNEISVFDMYRSDVIGRSIY